MTEDEVALEVLRKARELISQESAWTQGAFARDANGKPCGMTSDSAVCWCAGGALIAAAHVLGHPEKNKAWNALQTYMGCSVIGWNDQRRKHRSILQAFDRAIKLVSSKLERSDD